MAHSTVYSNKANAKHSTHVSSLRSERTKVIVWSVVENVQIEVDLVARLLKGLTLKLGDKDTSLLTSSRFLALSVLPV